MAPQLTDGKEVRFNVDRRRHTLLVRELHPKTKADFVVSSATSRQDQGSFTSVSGAGIAVDEFYVAQQMITGHAASANLWVLNTPNVSAIVAQFED
jgi:hypothetical protein